MEEGHFWTCDVNGELLQQPPWVKEGPACFVFSAPNTASGIVPFYRFFNQGHFWTCDPNGEGWGGKEGPAAYVYNSQVAGSVALYRFYNDATGEHFWTCDPKGELLPKPAFHLEGPACFVLPTAIPGNPSVVPFWRFFKDIVVITGMSPSSGPAGTRVTLMGANVHWAQKVVFNNGADVNCNDIGRPANNTIVVTVPNILNCGGGHFNVISVAGRSNDSPTFHYTSTSPSPVAQLVFVAGMMPETNPSWPIANKDLVVGFHYTNIGNTASEPFSIKMVLDNGTQQNVSCPAARPGEDMIAWWHFPSGLPAGRHNIDAYLAGQVKTCSFLCSPA